VSCCRFPKGSRWPWNRVAEIDVATPPGPLSVKVVVQLRAGGADVAQLRDIATWGAEHCPVLDGLRRSVPVEVSIEA